LHGVSGGAERVLVDVANGLHRRGYPVTVLTYQERNGPSFYPLDYGIRWIDGRKRHSRRRRAEPLGTLGGPARRHRSVAVALWLIQHVPKTWHLRRTLRIARPDVVIGFLPSTFPYLALAATGSGVPVVASLHNVPNRDLGDDPLRWDQNPVDIEIRRRALRTSAANTVLLPSFSEQLDADLQAKSYVIPNLIEPYLGPLTDVSTDPLDNVILAVGRLSPAKDHATLISAWKTLEADCPAWRLRIIGDGPLHDDLVAQIEQLGLQRAVVDEPTNEIERAYMSAKFVVMSSIYEGFGLVTAEAMACGLPVIGFADCEGTNEIVLDGENGVLVEPGADRVTALAAGMRRLIDDEDERRALATAAPGTVERFRPEPVLDSWERLIADVVHGTVPS
jgi:glycosyltransferase involved in cell wall biosynthesis